LAKSSERAIATDRPFEQFDAVSGSLESLIEYIEKGAGQISGLRSS
jgi:hypothetical protein